MATMSLLGLYNYDDTIFEHLNLPTGIDKTFLINKLLIECAELEILYTDPDFLKFAIGNWSDTQGAQWERLYNAMTVEYDPIENYNRYEEEETEGTDTHTGTDSRTYSGTDSRTYSGQTGRTISGTDSGTSGKTNKITAYDSNALDTHDTEDITSSQTRSGTETGTDSGTETGTDSGTDTNTKNLTDGHSSERVSHIHGNIGVTTSQMMLESELVLIPKLNVYEVIVSEFKKRFCILVY